MSSNGSNFVSSEIKSFLQNGIKHISFEERAVRTLREEIKAHGDGTVETKLNRLIPVIALLHKESPAQLC